MAEKAPLRVCVPVRLPPEQRVAAAKTAVARNPANAPRLDGLRGLTGFAAEVMEPQHIAVLTQKYWGPKGVDLDVYFMDTTSPALTQMILSHMNAWGERCNVRFRLSNSPSAKVRIARTAGDGYWSYLGTDVLHIPAGRPTMNLDSFTERTPLSEYKRVVRHETGHTLGCPHEHMRREVIDLLDPAKTIDWFLRYAGWDADTTRQQVLTPVSEGELLATPHAERDSIMCYQFPGDCTRDGREIPGGLDITEHDFDQLDKLYPPAVAPPPPVDPHTRLTAIEVGLMKDGVLAWEVRLLVPRIMLRLAQGWNDARIVADCLKHARH